MDIFNSRKKVNEVFTPRRHEINQQMYIDRPGLEKALRRAMDGSQHVLLCGESGNGKSWLYKKVFGGNVDYVAANCANADRLSSLTQEIYSVAFPKKVATKVGYSESKEAEINAVVASGKLIHEGNFEYTGGEQLLTAFEKIWKDSGKVGSILVLENLESIFNNSDRMNELANIILLLDDPRYATLKVKLLIVGTPSGVLEYFSKIKNLESVSNRLMELRKVDGFGQPQVSELVKKGFVGGLKVQLSPEEIEILAKKIFNITMGVAQRVHEYCEQLAYQIEDNNWTYSRDLWPKADMEWLNGGLRQSYTVVESNLNSRDTSVARRNQVIYSIGRIRTHQFDSGDIEKIIREDFPETIPETNMGIGSILTELSRSDDALLVRHEKTGLYRVKDPRYTMCIRVILYKNKSTGKVAKKNFKNS